jgi:formate hydrogenlyase transcriptional activator
MLSHDGMVGLRGVSLAQAERELIVATLERTGWRLEGDGGAAKLLGINPSTLRSRMLKLEIRRAAQAASPPTA